MIRLYDESGRYTDAAMYLDSFVANIFAEHIIPFIKARDLHHREAEFIIMDTIRDEFCKHRLST